MDYATYKQEHDIQSCTEAQMERAQARPVKTSNSNCRKYVESKTNFRGSNMWGTWIDNIYTVYSWGQHFPMYVYDPEADQWFGNSERFSRSTSKHQSQARPRSVVIQWFDTDTMQHIAEEGIAAAVAHRMAFRMEHGISLPVHFSAVAA